MEHVTNLIAALAWPVTVLLVVSYFRRPLAEIAATVASHLRQSRAVRAKMGGLEINVDLVEQFQKRASAIAQEPSAEKRLQMARDPLLLEEVLKTITPEQVAELEKSYRLRLKDAFTVNWYEITEPERRALQELESKGLIRGYEMYGDSIEWFTPLGVLLLKKLGAYEREPDVQR